MSETVKKKASTGNGSAYYSVIKNGEYGPVKLLGPLVETSTKENNNTSSSSAGDQIYLQATEFGGTDVTFSIYHMTEEAQCDCYGHKRAEGGGIIKNSNDVIPYIALMLEGHSTTEDGRVTDYVTLYKGMLQAPEKKTKTKEKGQTEFQTLSITGSFQDRDDGLHQHIVSSDDEDFDKDEFLKKWGKEVIIPTEKEIVPAPTNLVASAGTNEADLTFSKTDKAKTVKLQYAEGSGEFKDVSIGSSSDAYISAALDKNSTSCKVENLKSSKEYKFRLVINGSEFSNVASCSIS